MAVTHALATRQGVADYVTGQIDVGGAGSLIFQLANGTTEVATLTFSAVAFGAADGSAVCTADAITSDTDATGNASPVAVFEIRSGGGASVLSGLVGTSGSDINLSSLTIGAGDTVSMSSLTYTVPA